MSSKKEDTNKTRYDRLREWLFKRRVDNEKERRLNSETGELYKKIPFEEQNLTEELYREAVARERPPERRMGRNG